MSGCAHSNDYEMPVSPGELCPVDGAGTDHAQEDLEPEFDCEEEAASRAPVKVADPKLPSAEEVETHNLTHLPYRSWCPHCVRGKGKTMDHRRAGRGKTIPELHVDYCFMGSKGDAATRCIVVAKDYEHKCVMASVVPVKGSSHELRNESLRSYESLVWKARTLCFVATRSQPSRTCWRRSERDGPQRKHSTRSLLWDRRLRMAWPREEYKLSKGKFGY